MPNLLIEVDRGDGWISRQEGAVDLTPDQAAAYCLTFAALQYPHRVWLDGTLIATAERPHGKRGKARLVRRD